MKTKKAASGRIPDLPATIDVNGFNSIDGRHPLQSSVPDSHVLYRAHTRPGAEVLFFNFQLAREMGLIAEDSEEKLTKPLLQTLLHTFSLEIINEYDIEHGKAIHAADIRPYHYMATRYLQLQHRDKIGKNSGDGRSIWNGIYKGKNSNWDISSCGTGATRLSPATSSEGRFIQTGSPNVSYGCGRANVEEGISAALNSEIFHYNDIPTERTLAILAFSDGTSINVRAAPNLLRPAHMFRYLKQDNLDGLKKVVDYYIKREIDNNNWPVKQTGGTGYKYLLQRVTDDFSRVAALFETEYVFCWLDWDGDNVLMNGGVIDYGSIRQFGLFHREYRYDDVERLSTNISSQKYKARYTCQVFAQLTDALLTGKKKPLKTFSRHPMLKKFDANFQQTRDQLLLYRIGFDPASIRQSFNNRKLQMELQAFRKAFEYFERKQASYGIYEVTDGFTSDAIFCMRDILRELPKHYLQGSNWMEYGQFIDIMKSDYALPEDIKLKPHGKRMIRQFQSHYQSLVKQVAAVAGRNPVDVLRNLSDRSALINRYERVTGDAIIHVSGQLLKQYKRSGAMEMYRIFRHFVEQQILRPEHAQKDHPRPPSLRKTDSRKVLKQMQKAVRQSREGI